MERFLIIILAILLAFFAAFAQGASGLEHGALLAVETRLALVESRVARVESDIAKLEEVPAQLARIEEKVTALGGTASNSAGVLQHLGLVMATALITGAVSFSLGRQKR